MKCFGKMDGKKTPFDPKKKPRKGILKQSASFETPSSRTTPSSSKAMKFDEMNIIETLHPADKDYGHMKIEEPNTPFEKSVPDETDAVDPDLLSKKIAQASPRRAPSASSSSEDEDEEAQARKKAFQKQRAKHYDEAGALKNKKKLPK